LSFKLAGSDQCEGYSRVKIGYNSCKIQQKITDKAANTDKLFLKDSLTEEIKSKQRKTAKLKIT
jgi:hypothetical protein